jgi:site-specific DNA recombinase
MLAAVEARRVDAIVTWRNDRLHRSPRELEAFIDLVERTGVRLAVVTGGDYDLTTPDGRLSARIVGAVARKESEDRRVRRKHLELAEQGRPAGQLGWGVPTAEERELVREAAARVLAGHDLMTIVRDRNRQGVRGAGGDRGQRPPCAGHCSRLGSPDCASTASIRAGGRSGSCGPPAGRAHWTARAGTRFGPCC